MQKFQYTICDRLGIHARPAGQLCKLAKEYKSRIIISKDNVSVDATKLIALMGMGIKQYDIITVQTEGEDEEAAMQAVLNFLKQNL